ncbi:uroporphyrinogen-III synthase [Paenibacillus sp. FSL K6-1096]|uniref:uroporphyrinogen-III synthase n=1 Tax=Paenibacillus sp. FSL K6-1096 TaxID=2921460 RepID=UPI0030EC58EA
MAEQLKGLTVALAGPRKAEEMAKLVENMGGTALHRPAQGTSFVDDAALHDGLKAWVEQPPDLAVLTTGMGLEALFETAGKLGMAERFLEVLSASPVAARGYKTVNALKKRGLEPAVRDDDGSNAGLIRGLQGWNLRGKRVMLQLHGETAPQLTGWLEQAGATVGCVQPYRYTEPEPGALEQLLNEITTGQVDAVAFTSAPQFRFLAQHAREQGRLEALVQALEDKVLAVSVGRVTSEALKEEGVQRIIMPERERMGSMLVSLGQYLAANRR